MKSGNITKWMLLAALSAGCTDNKKQDGEGQHGTPIDTSVVGKDSTSIDTRPGIEESDPAKQTLPGRDTTNSDEPQ